MTQPKNDRRPDPFENDEQDAEIPMRTLRGLVAALRSSTELLEAVAATLPVAAREIRDIAAALDGFL